MNNTRNCQFPKEVVPIIPFSHPETYSLLSTPVRALLIQINKACLLPPAARQTHKVAWVSCTLSFSPFPRNSSTRAIAACTFFSCGQFREWGVWV